MDKTQAVRRHLRRISTEKPAPMKAQSETVCGTFVLTGQIKCVDADSPKANFIEIVPIP